MKKSKLRPISLVIISFMFLVSTFVFKFPISVNAQTPEPTVTEQFPNNDKLLPQIQDLMETNDSCILPCFGGLVPGEASATDIETLLRTLDEDDIIRDQIDDEEDYSFSLFFREEGFLTAGLSVEDKHLERITMFLTNPNQWLPNHMFSLNPLLIQMGTPDDIFIQYAGPPLRFSMVFVYNQMGVMLRYRADFTEGSYSEDQPLPVCLSKDVVELREIAIWLQNPENDTLVEQNQPDLRDEERDTRPFWSIDRITQLNAEEFTEFFINNPDDCVDAFSPDEMKEQGYVF